MSDGGVATVEEATHTSASGKASPALMPKTAPRLALSVMIVNWNTCRDLLQCLASIYANPPTTEFEVLIVDNASFDGSAEGVASGFPQVRLFTNPENLGFARANNLAAAQANGRYWLLLNPDTVPCPGAIASLLEYLDSRPGVAAVGPKLVNPDGTLQPSIQRLPTLFREWWRLFHLDRLHALSEYPPSVLAQHLPRPVEVLNGACLMLRRAAVEPLGLFDEDYFVYSEEVDLCDRLRRAGWQLHWVPQAIVTHTGGQSTRQVADQMFLELYRNKLKFFRKRRSRLTALLYKGVLFQAALVRLLLARVQQGPTSRRRSYRDVARQYRLLLAELPKL